MNSEGSQGVGRSKRIRSVIRVVMNRRGSWTPYGAGAEAVRRVVGSKPTPGFRSSSKVEEKKEEMLRDMRGGERKGRCTGTGSAAGKVL